MATRAGHTAFRSDVQALRAVAVAGVVLFHLWPSALPGGFVGVDVFFVISGYLITGQLVGEATRTGRVSLTQFWMRRIRRILPAAFTVLGACIALVVLAMPRVTWVTNLGDIRASALYVENWHLGARAVDYLASSTTPTIVQHYWSLSVEEQFYLCWPLLVLVTAWLVARAGRGRSQRAVGVVLLAVAVASFIVSVVWTAHDSAMAFFATPTRAWEFAAGGLVAVTAPTLERLPKRTRPAIGWFGLAVVTASMFAITGAEPFPGAIAAVPVLGAALVVAAHAESEGAWSPAWSPARLYRNRAVQWLGDNSYSVYLWHWPPIIAGPWIVGRPLHWSDKLVILVSSLVLAALTKWLVEDPVRGAALWRHRRWPAYAIAAAGAAVLVVLSGGFTDEVAHLQRTERVAAARATLALVAHPSHRSCFGAAAMDPANHCARPFARPRHLDTAFAAVDGSSDHCLLPATATAPAFCAYGDTRGPRETIAIIGNSHAWRLVPALALYADRHKWEVIETARINCLGLITTAVAPDGASSSCLAWSNAVESHLLGMPHLDAVIFAGYRFWREFTAGPHPTSAEVAATRRQILAMWREYDARRIKVLVTQDVPGMRPILDPSCLAQSHAKYDPCWMPRNAVVRPSLPATLAQRHPSLARYLPLDQYFCDARRCHALIGGVVVYFDAQHLTTTYSRSLSRYLGAEVAAALGLTPLSPAHSIDGAIRATGG